MCTVHTHHTTHNSGLLDSFDDADDIELIYKSQYKKKAAAKFKKKRKNIDFYRTVYCENSLRMLFLI